MCCVWAGRGTIRNCCVAQFYVVCVLARVCSCARVCPRCREPGFAGAVHRANERAAPAGGVVVRVPAAQKERAVAGKGRMPSAVLDSRGGGLAAEGG